MIFFRSLFYNLFHSKVEFEPETSPYVSPSKPFPSQLGSPSQLSTQIIVRSLRLKVELWSIPTCLGYVLNHGFHPQQPPWSLPKLDVGQQVCITDNPPNNRMWYSAAKRSMPLRIGSFWDDRGWLVWNPMQSVLHDRCRPIWFATNLLMQLTAYHFPWNA